jgi:hypothetical protein
MKRPRFYLRDLFWLVALAAMGCGWWVDRGAQLASADAARFETHWEGKDRDWWRDLALTLADSCRKEGWDVVVDREHEQWSINTP